MESVGCTNITPTTLCVNAESRAQQMGQKPFVLWFTGISGAGKSTLANFVDARLYEYGRHTYLLDGDNVRLGLNRDLGFSDSDRRENIRRVGEVAKLMVDAGLIVIAAFISPFRADREAVRNLFAAGAFFEVFIDTSIDSVRTRDVKGLYKKSDKGEICALTGVDSSYEVPGVEALHISTEGRSIESCGREIMEALRELISGPDFAPELDAMAQPEKMNVHV